MNFLRNIVAIVHKDLLTELRKKERLNTLLYFGVLVVFLFSFALGKEPALLKTLAPGLLWLVILLSSLFALEASFQTEVEEECLDRLLLYSVHPQGIFLGKLITNFLWISLVGIIVFFSMIFLFDLGKIRNLSLFTSIFFLGNFGIATLGTFYSALMSHLKARASLLPLLLFPMLMPLLLSCVFATQEALSGGLSGVAALWIRVLIVYDTVFFAATLLTVGNLLEG